MNKTWAWILGVVLVLGLASISFFSNMPAYAQYPMMSNGYGWHMPMMQSGYGMWGLGMFWMWLIQLGLLVTVGLSIAALIKYLKTTK